MEKQSNNIINKALTQGDVKSFLKGNDKIAKFTLDFFNKYMELCDKQNIKFRLDAGCGGSLFPFFLSSFYKMVDFNYEKKFDAIFSISV